MQATRPRTAAAVALTLVASGAAPVAAQGDSAVVIRGMVVAEGARPVEGANVFLLETLEGAVTRTDGLFAIATRQHGTVTIAVRRVGFRLAQRQVVSGADSVITITLTAAAPMLEPVRVLAGTYTAGDERGATLTSLEVATTPGATANIDRTIQTLPGVQMVDEGTGLFVRGGDVGETKILLNQAMLLSPVHLETPTGNFVGTVSPFLLDGISFSAGGFGARWGDALSAVASLTTLGRVTHTQGTVSVGLGAVSAGGAVALPHGVGVRGTATTFHDALMFKVNGSTRDYDPVPQGRDVSASGVWSYRPTGELKLFGVRQGMRYGLLDEEASYSGEYALRQGSDLAVASWRDVVGRIAPTLTVSTSGSTRDEAFGAFDLSTHVRMAQVVSQNEWSVSERATLRAGGEWERQTATYDGSIPKQSYDRAPGARTTTFAADVLGVRTGAYAEGDWRLATRLRATTGLRTDRSTLTAARTLDPRLSAAYKVGAGVTLTAAWGIYHQVPDPLFFAPALGGHDTGAAALPPMRATQLVVGAQAGEGETIGRVELYTKRYRDLAQLTRDKTVAAGGTGTSRGADVFLKGPLPRGFTGRVTYSLVDAERTDPNTGLMARAPFDITQSVTAIVERRWSYHWRVSGAYHYATGRPFTDVTGATPDEARGVWIPTYGAPMAERLPAFQRLDLGASWFEHLTPTLQGVFFVAAQNALDRENVYAYRYSADYTRRVPVRSLFKRSIYFGMSITSHG